MRVGKVIISVLPAVMALAIAACGPGAPGAPQNTAPAPPTTPQRTLVVAVRGEPPSLASKPLFSFSGGLLDPGTVFNATLDYNDERAVTHPTLPEALPQLNTDTWRVLPDGRMETTYRLRPNLTWQDGHPLAADEFAFAYRIYSDPAMGSATTVPFSQLQDVTAPDARTLVLHWKQPYPDATVLGRNF